MKNNSASQTEQLAVQREKLAASMSDDEIILHMALNILKNEVLDPDMKFQVLLGSITSLSRIYHAIKIAFHQLLISPYEYHYYLRRLMKFQPKIAK